MDVRWSVFLGAVRRRLSIKVSLPAVPGEGVLLPARKFFPTDMASGVISRAKRSSSRKRSSYGPGQVLRIAVEVMCALLYVASYL